MRTSITFIAGAVTLFILQKILTRQTKIVTPVSKPPSDDSKPRTHPWHIRPYVQTTTGENVEIPWPEQEAQPDVPVTKKRKRGRPPKKVSENKRAKDAAYQLARVDAIRAMLEEDPNYTLEELGEHFGVTRERIRQILVRHNIQKGYGQRHRKSYALATFENKSLVSIGTPNRNDPEIPRDIFDPASPNFVGVAASKINTISVYIRTPSPKHHEHTKLNFTDPYRKTHWRCYTCKPLYAWDYIQETGKIGKESETKPCNNCGTPVTKRAAILHRIRESDKYHGNFYCNRNCFYEWQNHKSPTPWYTASPIHQDTYHKDLPDRLHICVVCNTEFKTKYVISKLCSLECKKIRTHQLAKERKLTPNEVKSSPVIRAIKELGTYGLRIPYIAERLNISENTLAQWSSGQFEPSNTKETLRQLKRLLQMTKRLS